MSYVKKTGLVSCLKYIPAVKGPEISYSNALMKKESWKKVFRGP